MPRPDHTHASCRNRSDIPTVEDLYRLRDLEGASPLDGMWYLGCTTTHIYCRPTCTAHVNPQNLTVFPSAAAAEAAGFRPCLRCCPESAPRLPVVANDPATALASLIEENLASPDCFERACATLRLDAPAGIDVGALFALTYGATPRQYEQTARRLLAKTLLAQTGLAPDTIAHACGYPDMHALARDFQVSYRLDIGRMRPKRRSEALVVALGYRTPYRHDLLVDFLAFRAIRGVETVDGDRYARTCAIGDDTGWITVEDDPAKSRLLLSVSESLAPHVAQLAAKTRRLFDADCLPGEVSHALSGFHRQAGERYRIEGIRLPCSFGGFEMSVRAIIGQQITVKAANTLAGRLAQRFGIPCDTPFEGLDTVFPDPSAFASDEAVEAMGELGIIKRRAQAIRLLAEGFADGSLEWGAGCDAQQSLQKLVALPGIGPWTANYLLMRAFHYTDGFPAADYGVKLGFPGLTPKEIERLSEAWRPYRSYAVMSLWCAPHD